MPSYADALYDTGLKIGELSGTGPRASKLLRPKIKGFLFIACCQFVVPALVYAGEAKRAPSTETAAPSKTETFIRTESYPRPPYSGATYYIYERNGQVICTKIELCNKFDDCEIRYKKGSYKDEEDVQSGDPYGKSAAVAIPSAKLKRHVCLEKFHLN